jgi:hypothetical protein
MPKGNRRMTGAGKRRRTMGALHFPGQPALFCGKGTRKRKCDDTGAAAAGKGDARPALPISFAAHMKFSSPSIRPENDANRRLRFSTQWSCGAPGSLALTGKPLNTDDLGRSTSTAGAGRIISIGGSHP